MVVASHRGMLWAWSVPLVATSMVWAQPAPHAARSAFDFVDSIGVNIHMHYTDTPYTSYDDVERAHRFGKVKQALADLRVRHIRDALLDTAWQPFYDQINELYRDLGISATLIYQVETRFGGVTLPVERMLEVAERFESIAAFEGYNEFDNPWIYNLGPNWHEELRAAQRAIYLTVNASPRWAGTPVVGPSLVNPASYALVGDLSAYMDYGNTHPYAGGQHPEAHIQGEMARQRPLSGDLPIWATEIGYHTALSHTGGHRPVSEAIKAVYLPRMFMENFRIGIVRTFDYELIDSFDRGPEDPESHFGLLRFDHSRTPAFYALARLTSLLHDESGEGFVPGELHYSLTGRLAGVRQVLLQKSNGHFYLALWRDVSSWNRDTLQEIDVEAIAGELVLPAGMFTKAQAFLPSQSGDPVWSVVDPARVPIQLTDELMVIRIIPEPSAGLMIPAAGMLLLGRRRLGRPAAEPSNGV